MTHVKRPRLGIIGYGNMASAMVTRWTEVGLISQSELIVSTKSGASEAFLSLGVENRRNQEVVDQSDIILLAIKPQQIHEVARPLSFRAEQIVLSVLAGTPLETLTKHLSPAQTVRLMPNLAVGLGVGIVAEMGLAACESNFTEWINTALDACGSRVSLVSESLFDGVTALAGSAPAFCFVMAQALADAAVLEGVPRAQSERLAAAVLEGAGAMLKQGGLTPETLKDRVASPKGTTITGLRALEARGFRSAVIEAVAASSARSRELSKG